MAEAPEKVWIDGAIKGRSRGEYTAFDAANHAMSPHEYVRADLAAPHLSGALVEVKPLDWVQVSHETAFVAITSIGTFTVKWVPDMHVWTYNNRPFENVSLAKAAAQADYEWRILSALTIRSQDEMPEVRQDG